MPDDSTPTVHVVLKAEDIAAIRAMHCSATMTIGRRRTRRQKPCPLMATRLINDKPYCSQHGPSRYRIDPFYDTPGWRQLRQKVLERDGYECQYCGKKATQADHVVPRKKGGADAMKNLVACCPACNKAAANTKFGSFAEKKAYVLSHRKRQQPRPKPELDQWQRDLTRLEPCVDPTHLAKSAPSD